MSLRALCGTQVPFALATVVGSSGSTPRPLGSMMAVAADGTVVGSLSGGCVEGAVYDVALQVLATGQAVTETFGVADDDGLAVGLTCGGVLEVLVAPGDSALLGRVFALVTADVPVCLVTRLDTGTQLAVTSGAYDGGLGDPALDDVVRREALAMLVAGTTGVRHLGAECSVEDVPVLVQSFVPPPRLLVFGATDFSGGLARLGGFLGYRTTVCDPRPAFTTPGRFPEADEVVCAWPPAWFQDEVLAGRVDARTVVAVLTHDDRFDVDLLAAALGSPARYVGAMGSRRTHDSRVRRLREAGVSDDAIGRLRSPIGLDVGGRTAEETAVSIAAELVLTRWGGTGLPLAEVTGDIHRSASPAPSVVG